MADEVCPIVALFLICFTIEPLRNESAKILNLKRYLIKSNYEYID